MSRFILSTIVSTLLTVGLWLPSSAVPAAAPGAASEARVTRVLGVGNSYTRDAFRYLDHMGAHHAPHRLVVGRAIVSASRLDRHVRWFREHEADPAAGRPYAVQSRNAAGETVTEHYSLKELLRMEPWDVVSIQQLSRLSVDADTYRPYAQSLTDYIRSHAPQAEVVLHQTWAWRVDAFPTDTLTDQTDMYRRLSAAYAVIAAELDLRTIPVGRAFQVFREERPLVIDTSSDPATLEPPHLPADRNSLNRGWRWRRPDPAGPPVLNRDLSHAGPLGQYLAAAVWFEFLTGSSPFEAGVRIADLSEADQQFLSDIAHQVVARERRPAIEDTRVPPVGLP